MQALRRRQRRQRGGVAVGIVGHVRLDLRAQLARDLDQRRIRNAGRVLLEVGRLVPAGPARAVLEAQHGHGPGARGGWTRRRSRAGRAALAGPRAHRSMPPRIGSSIATVAIMSAI